MKILTKLDKRKLRVKQFSSGGWNASYPHPTMPTILGCRHSIGSAGKTKQEAIDNFIKDWVIV